MKITDGTTTVIVNDNDPSDTNGAVGAVGYTGQFGSNWVITVNSGVTKPQLGSATQPFSDLNSFALSVGAGTLTVEFSEDGFGPASGPTTNAIGGTVNPSGGSVTYTTLVNGFSVQSMGPYVAGGAYNETVNGTVSIGASSKITQRVVIVHTGTGQSSADCQFQLTPPPPPVTGKLGDFVWNDLNQNGIQDAGEPGIDGVTVTLKNSGGSVVGTTITSNNGFYQFTGLAADTYTVTVDTSSAPLTNMVATAVNAAGSTTANDSNGSPAVVTLGDGESNQTIDFGYYLFVPPTGKIGDFVWLDLNQNGVQDSGESGINGVTVKLKDSGGNTVGSTTTTGNGGYLFTGLSAGSYTVCVDASTLPPGLIPTIPNAGGNPAMDSNGSPSPVTLTTNSSVDLTIDFGYIPAPNGSLGDFVWKDLNGDGQQDVGEPGIQGVTVKLFLGSTTSGTPYKTTVTDMDGYYLFTQLASGDYTVQVDTSSPSLAGYTPTLVNYSGGVNTADDSNPNPAFVNLPLNTSKDTTIDFGFVPPPTGAIGDFVWKDLNHNGIQDAGEPGINNVTIYLKDQYGNLLATTVTAGNGGYLFTGLTAGNYIVQLDATDADLAGLVPTTVNAAGSTTANDSNPNPAMVTLATDSSVDRTTDFGFYAPGCGCIGDRVWYDCDGDGIQDCNEPGIKGVTVKLYYNGTLIATTVTDSCGYYHFTGLFAGTYTVVVDNNQTPLTGLSPTKALQGYSRAYDSNGSPATVTLATSKSCDYTIDFGFKKYCPPCPITTCNPGSWCNKYNSFCQVLDGCWDKLYPCGLSIGCGRYMKFTSCQSVKNFLPCYGTYTCLQQTYCNPSTQIGCLAGHVVCLRLAVDCSKGGYTCPGLGNCKINSGKFCGWTVSQLLNQAESCLGGSRLPYGCTYKDLSDACALVNDNYNLGCNLGKCTPQ